MTKMMIPNMYNIPRPRSFPTGKDVTGTISKKELRAMVVALEQVGLLVLNENGQQICRVNGKEILRATKGNRGTYLARYAEGVKLLVNKMK